MSLMSLTEPIRTIINNDKWFHTHHFLGMGDLVKFYCAQLTISKHVQQAWCLTHMLWCIEPQSHAYFHHKNGRVDGYHPSANMESNGKQTWAGACGTRWCSCSVLGFVTLQWPIGPNSIKSVFHGVSADPCQTESCPTPSQTAVRRCQNGDPPHSSWLTTAVHVQRFSFRLWPRVNRSTRALQELFAFHMNRSQRAGVFQWGQTHLYWNFKFSWLSWMMTLKNELVGY